MSGRLCLTPLHVHQLKGARLAGQWHIPRLPGRDHNRDRAPVVESCVAVCHPFGDVDGFGGWDFWGWGQGRGQGSWPRMPVIVFTAERKRWQYVRILNVMDNVLRIRVQNGIIMHCRDYGRREHVVERLRHYECARVQGVRWCGSFIQEL